MWVSGDFTIAMTAAEMADAVYGRIGRGTSLDNAAGDAHSTAAKFLRRVGVVVTTGMNHQGVVFHF
ncbi:hypothetical protein DZS_00070 [Dickeya ananatis]